MIYRGRRSFDTGRLRGGGKGEKVTFNATMHTHAHAQVVFRWAWIETRAQTASNKPRQTFRRLARVFFSPHTFSRKRFTDDTNDWRTRAHTTVWIFYRGGSDH